MDIRLKRAYAEPSTSDGPRLLVDRIWPRGVAKEDASVVLGDELFVPTSLAGFGAAAIVAECSVRSDAAWRLVKPSSRAFLL